MAELVNLRTIRKRARRRRNDERADANRLAHGISKKHRSRVDIERTLTERALDGHRIDKGETS